jgi:hypothetical protein
MLGGMVLCSSDKTDLMMLVMPEAPSEWPTFGFTYDCVSYMGFHTYTNE